LKDDFEWMGTREDDEINGRWASVGETQHKLLETIGEETEEGWWLQSGK
jgi:hypothetical protein